MIIDKKLLTNINLCDTIQLTNDSGQLIIKSRTKFVVTKIFMDAPIMCRVAPVCATVINKSTNIR